MCEGHGPARPVPRRGCGPDGARRGGLSGRLRMELSCGCDRSGVTVGGLTAMPDAYLGWHRGVRAKSDSGHRSPMRCRRDSGPVA